MNSPSHAATAAAVALDNLPDTADAAADDGAPRERLLDHACDGIREFDNPLPGWWSLVFGACVAFAILYFAYYDIVGGGRPPAERYKLALVNWQATYKAGPGGGGGPSVTEEMLAAGAESPDLMARGAEVFASRCVGCHTADGRGQIGPNLTDLFQIRGTTRMDLYATIQGGSPGTAMIAWSEVMKPAEIIAVATFVSTLRGKNLAGKEPQGKPVPAFAR